MTRLILYNISKYYLRSLLKEAEMGGKYGKNRNVIVHTMCQSKNVTGRKQNKEETGSKTKFDNKYGQDCGVD